MSELQMPEALLIRRVMDPTVQAFLAQEVLQNIGGYSLASISVKRLAVGDADVALLPEHVYGKALYHPDGVLKQLTTEDSKELLEENVRRSPTGSELMVAETVETDFRESANSIVIFYGLKQPKLSAEAKRFAGTVGVMNGIPLETEKTTFPDALILSLLPKKDRRRDRLIEAFEHVRPKLISLMAAKVLTGSELREQTRQAEVSLMDRLRAQADDRRRRSGRGGK